MPRLLIVDDRDQTVEMCHRHLPQFEYVTRCGRAIPCQVCEERDRGCPLKCAHDYFEAAEELRRRQGLLILERLRNEYPTLPVVMLTATEQELPPGRSDGQADGPGGADPLVYFCENEVVDSRSLASEITRALALSHQR